MPVRSVFFLGEGLYSGQRLETLSADKWQDLRHQINKAAPKKIAFCLTCNQPVFVRALSSTLKEPHFCHFSGGGLGFDCGPDSTKQVNTIRAEIFNGYQESEIHRIMCETVLDLAMRDTRYIADSGKVDSYSQPTDGTRHGRWPDVQFEFARLGKFAVEVQNAPSVSKEVIERSDFYFRQGRKLIWLLPWYNFETVERAYARDIASEANNNFFVFDSAAIEEGKRRGTFVFWAAWKSVVGISKELIDLGSGLIDHIQKITKAAIAIADIKVWAQRS